MTAGTPLDKRIKEGMVADALFVKGVPVPTGKVRRSASTGNLASSAKSASSANAQREILKRRMRTGTLGSLTAYDLEVVKTAAAEFVRAASTNFEVVYPSQASVKRLSKYFVYPRYNNTLLKLLLLQQANDSAGCELESDEEETAGSTTGDRYFTYPTSKPLRRR